MILSYLVAYDVGLRGRMEAGFSRMNDLTVIQASQVLSTKKYSNSRVWQSMSFGMLSMQKPKESYWEETTDIIQIHS